MIKLVADALTGVVWVDDSQVSEVSGAVQRGVDDARTHILVYETTAAMPPTQPCRTCGKPVRQYKSQPNYYCSRECSGLASRRRVDLPCAQCGGPASVKQAYVSRVKTTYCSDKCRRAHRQVTRPCETCGTDVTWPKSQARTRTFCKSCERPPITHCKHGHEYTPENTYMSQGRKNCRICRAAASVRRRERLREAK